MMHFPERRKREKSSCMKTTKIPNEEEPSMVVRLSHAKDEDGRKVGVQAKFLKIERRMLILGTQSGSTF